MKTKLTPYLAVGIAEGFEEAETEKQFLEAWQYIYDNELYLGLQGRFGRTLESLIEQGYINTNNKTKNK
tara:strand:- start:505 stop:711 length:207 start_codon:yes stop_codon:yes gene_type:complete